MSSGGGVSSVWQDTSPTHRRAAATRRAASGAGGPFLGPWRMWSSRSLASLAEPDRGVEKGVLGGIMEGIMGSTAFRESGE